MYFFITGIFFKTIVTAVPKKHADKIHIIHEGRVCKYGNRLVNIDDVTFLYICSNKYIPNVHDPAIVRIFPGFPDNLWLANHIFAAKYTVAAGININVPKKFWHVASLHSLIKLQW